MQYTNNYSTALVDKGTKTSTIEGLSLAEELNSSIAHQHREEWRKSGVNDDIINANVRTIYSQLEVDKLLNRRTKRMWKRPEDLVPCWAVTGIDPLTDMPTPQGIQLKPNVPRINEKGKPVKYESARNEETAPLFLDTGKEGFWINIRENVNEKIFICEGGKKAGNLLSHGYAAISIPGVSTCRKRGRLHQNLELFAKVGRTFYLTFDNDLLTKKPVQDALRGMAAVLASFGSVVMIVQLPPGEFKGVDDYIVGCGIEAFNVLVDNALTAQEWLEEIKQQETEEEEDTVINSRLARHYNLVKEKWGDNLRYNSLTKEVELGGQELNEDEVRLIMALEFDIDITSTDACTVVGKLAKLDEYSPVVEYLNEVANKHKDIDPSFLDGLAEKYFGTTEPMHAVYFKKFLISAVARARNPGVKVDTVLMLVGEQGCGKSTFLQHLFGRDFFSDQIGGDLSDKDEKAKVSRYWCLEYAEFESVYKKKDVSSLKKFITSHEDTFRAPYARKEARHLRPSIFAGTTNETEILRDPTGDRRFWVLRILLEDIPLSELLKERDKIWAAADILYRQGHEFKLTKEEERSRTDLNKEFRTTHYWDDLIEQLWADSQPMTYLTTEMIAKRLGFDSAASVKGADLHTMKECMERLGFKKTTKRVNGVLTRSCWIKESFPGGSNNFSEKSDLPRNTVTTQPQQGVDPVTPLSHLPVTVEKVEVDSSLPDNSSDTVLHPPATGDATPSTPCTAVVSETVTVLHPQSSENLNSQKLEKIAECDRPAPAVNAELLRMALADKDWGKIEELGNYWAEHFGQEYRRQVWDCLTKQEQKSIKNLKPGETVIPRVDGIPAFEIGNIVLSFGKLLKITAIKSKEVEGYFAGEVEPSQVSFDDISACSQSKLLDIKVKDRIQPVTGKHKGKIFTVTTLQGNLVWCKGENQNRGTTPQSFYPHQFQKV